MYDLTWYYSLIQPPLTPPYWLFAPVWTILYLSMFTALLIYAIKPFAGDKLWGFTLFFIGLLINLSWIPVFFCYKNLILSLVIIIILDIITLFNIKEFFKVSKSAARTLVPYFIWILFATYLNAGIVYLN